jgi:bacillithiol biosynthesis deacetylase BshB1
MKLDILAFSAHPDDIELSCVGTLMKHIKEGKTVGIIDLTEGELGSRGSVELRYEEAAESSKIIGLSSRHNLQMADGYFEISEENKLKIVEQIRRFRPEIVLANAIEDRHPDHGRAAKLVSEACFLAGLRKVETSWEGVNQEAYRPKVVYHYIQDRYIKPDFVVDMTEFYERKMESIKAFKSQFYDPNSLEPPTPISGEDFLYAIEGRMSEFGRAIGVRYAEGFTVERIPGVDNFFDLK